MRKNYLFIGFVGVFIFTLIGTLSLHPDTFEITSIENVWASEGEYFVDEILPMKIVLPEDWKIKKTGTTIIDRNIQAISNQEDIHQFSPFLNIRILSGVNTYGIDDIEPGDEADFFSPYIDSLKSIEGVIEVKTNNASILRNENNTIGIISGELMTNKDGSTISINFQTEIWFTLIDKAFILTLYSSPEDYQESLSEFKASTQTFESSISVPTRSEKDNSFELFPVIDMLPTQPETPKTIKDIIMMVEIYSNSGKLDPGEAKKIISKLNTSKASLDKDNKNAASNQLKALINDIRAQKDKKIKLEIAQEIENAILPIIEEWGLKGRGGQKSLQQQAFDFQIIQYHRPLIQIKLGVVNEEVICPPTQKLLFKTTNGSPVCLFPDTAEKLVKRGWVSK